MTRGEFIKVLKLLGYVDFRDLSYKLGTTVFYLTKTTMDGRAHGKAIPRLYFGLNLSFNAETRELSYTGRKGAANFSVLI